MNANQYRLMFIPLLATLIMAGFVTTVGLLTEPASRRYGVDITDIAAQFTWFTGGVFLGGILAFFIFDYVAIKPVTIWSYVVSVALIVTNLRRIEKTASASWISEANSGAAWVT